jgi:hypothetical protein
MYSHCKTRVLHDVVEISHALHLILILSGMYLYSSTIHGTSIHEITECCAAPLNDMLLKQTGLIIWVLMLVGMILRDTILISGDGRFIVLHSISRAYTAQFLRSICKFRKLLINQCPCRIVCLGIRMPCDADTRAHRVLSNL